MDITVDPTLPPGAQQFLVILNWAAAITIVICVLAIIIALARLAIGAASGDRVTDAGKGVIIPIVAAAVVGSAAGIVLAVV